MPVISAFGSELQPGVEKVRRAILTKSEFQYADRTFTGAVYNALGALVFSSVRPAPPVTSRPIDRLTINRDVYAKALYLHEAIYAGHLFSHWGHFLVESLGAAANADTLPDIPVVYLPYGGADPGFLKHAMPLLSAAWQGREIILASEHMRFEWLHVAKRLTAYGVANPMMHEAVAIPFERIRYSLAGEARPSRRVLMIRANDHRRRLPNEEDICRYFVSRGFEAIQPERLTATEQVRFMAETQTMASFAGSITHNSVFMHRGTDIIDIGGPDEPANRAQEDLCQIWRQRFFHLQLGEDLAPLQEVLSQDRALLNSA